MATFALNGAYDYIINSTDTEATIEFLIPGVKKESVKVSSSSAKFEDGVEYSKLIVRVFDEDIKTDETVLNISNRWDIKKLQAELLLGILTIKIPIIPDSSAKEYEVK